MRPRCPGRGEVQQGTRPPMPVGPVSNERIATCRWSESGGPVKITIVPSRGTRRPQWPGTVREATVAQLPGAGEVLFQEGREAADHRDGEGPPVISGASVLSERSSSQTTSDGCPPSSNNTVAVREPTWCGKGAGRSIPQSGRAMHHMACTARGAFAMARAVMGRPFQCSMG